MGSSNKIKKHKKHRDKRGGGDGDQSVNNEQKPLKLVLKVPQSERSFNTASSSSNTAIAGISSASNLLSPQSLPHNIHSHIGHDVTSTPPKLVAFSDMAVSGTPLAHQSQTPMTSTPLAASSSTSLSKKLKKKKSKKKHSHKHSHHHSRHKHHSHSHARHHRHHGSCSHSHSRTSQDGLNKEGTTSSACASVSSHPHSHSAHPKSPQKSSSKGGGKTPFQQLMSHLWKQIQRKDIQQFFAWPVTDLIAPGYSAIISNPMDLSKIKKNIDQNKYETIYDLKQDVKLMCDNAMKYNRPETVYYKAANKLWHYARNKLLHREALAEIAKGYAGVTSYEVGFNVEDTSIAPKSSNAASNVGSATATDIDMNDSIAVSINETIGNMLDTSVPALDANEHEGMVIDSEVEEDGMTADQILEQARKAASEAAAKLTLKRPNGTHFSFLRQQMDGSTSLAIIGNHTQPQQEKVINLEALVGKLSEGTVCLPPFREAEVNKVRPIECINESPFTSYLPSVDSSKATLNEQDTSLLMSVYGGDEQGLQYAQSLAAFAGDADYVMHLVDSLLDVLTHGQHTKIAVKLREQQQLEQKLSQENQDDLIMNSTSDDPFQCELNETNSLIGQLENIQHTRLSSSTQTIKPSNEEEKLAHELTSKLTDIISNHAAPSDVSNVYSIRKAMGINIKVEK